MLWEVINIAKNKNIGCFVTEEEYLQIQRNVRRYGFKSTSDYLREALEFFDERRYNASKNIEVSIINDCINILNIHKKNVENNLLQQSLKNLNETLEGSTFENTKTLKKNDENLEGNLEGFDDETLKNLNETLESSKSSEIPKTINPFENIIQTLIRLTHVKGKPTIADFTYQASRCAKSPKEVRKYYEDNYKYFIEEANKVR